MSSQHAFHLTGPTKRITEPADRGAGHASAPLRTHALHTHTHTHTRAHTHMHTLTHTRICTLSLTYTHTIICTPSLTQVHTAHVHHIHNKTHLLTYVCTGTTYVLCTQEYTLLLLYICTEGTSTYTHNMHSYSCTHALSTRVRILI